MENEKSPEDFDNRETEGKARKIHQPEFVILEGGGESFSSGTTNKEQLEYIETLQKIGKMSFGWPVRIMCLSATIIAAASALVVFFFTVLSVLLASLALFMMKDVNAYMLKAINNLRKLLAITVGLFIAVFSPPLGLGMIVLYFMLHGEALSNGLFNRIFTQNN